MALITCPECGKEISDKAEACPNCGFPMTGSGSNEVNGKNEEQHISSILPVEHKLQILPKKKIVTAILLCAVLVVIVFLMLQNSGKTTKNIVGTWENSEDFDDLVITYEFGEHGEFNSYFKVKSTNFSVPAGEGEYTVSGNTLRLKMTTGEETDEHFSIDGNVMTFGDLTFKRIKNGSDTDSNAEKQRLSEDELAAISACQKIKDRLKSPDSLSLNSVLSITDEANNTDYIFVDFSAQNGFGGMTRDIWVYRDGSFYTSANDDNGYYDIAESTRDFCQIMGYHYVNVDISVIEDNLY